MPKNTNSGPAPSRGTTLPGAAAPATLTVKGFPMTLVQRNTAQQLIAVGVQHSASTAALVACIFDAIFESSVGADLGVGHTYGGVLGGAESIFDPSNSLVAEATAFYTGGQGFQGGGAIKLAASRTDVKYVGSQVTAATPFDSNGYSKQYESQGFSLDSAVSEATAIVAAFGGGTLAAGGTANVGSGTGTSPNSKPTSPFQLGTTSNPHEDVWTAINQYAQQRQWYLFSDGETVYLADGPDLLQQTPAMTLDRWGDADKLISISFTWDNTAFQFAVQRQKARTRVVKKSVLQKIQSPVSAQLSVICDIDEVRAGDIIYLSGCGPGNGKWLVADCTRSVFQIYSQITLVPPMAPLSELQAAGSSTSGKTGAAASQSGSGTVMALMLSAASTISNAKIPYVWGGGHAQAGTPSKGVAALGNNQTQNGYDCSGAVGAVLHAAGLLDGPVPGSGAFASDPQLSKLLIPGKGSGNPECTLYLASWHAFMTLNGQAWGSTAGGSGRLNGATNGGPTWWDKNVPQPYESNPAFSPYHFSQATLGKVIGGTNQVTPSGLVSPGGVNMLLPSKDYGTPRTAATITLIVLHDSEIANTPGKTDDLVSLRSTLDNQGLSVHVGIDGDGNVARFVADEDECYHCVAFNPVSLGIEQIGFAAQTSWPDAQIHKTAQQVAFWANKFNIPIAQSVISGSTASPGVCQHKDLGSAGGGHTDCGPSYPFSTVLALAKGYSGH